MSLVHRQRRLCRAPERLQALLFALLLSACIKRPEGAAAPNAPGSDPAAPSDASTKGASTAPPATLPEGASIAKKYEKFFPVGVAVTQKHLTTPTIREIITTHFNRLTAENAWKWGELSPSKDRYDWGEADFIAAFAREHKMAMTGHALVWHRQAPGWVFARLQNGDPQAIETVKARLKAHIDTVIPRYADVVDNWDVVNEAISDSGDKTYRDATEGSKFYGIFGSEEYVYLAFLWAQQAYEAHAPGSSEGKLYYNDYNVVLKIDRIIPMLNAVREKGARVDGIGMQFHVRLDWPSVADLDATMQKIIAAGYKIKVSELDVNLYNDYPDGKFKAAPAVDFTPELAEQQAKRYAELFALFRKHAEHITSVTLWGVSDDSTWLDHEPVGGRNNHPLLFDDQHRPKAAAAAILDF
ncbi:MAG TPA: endo-1,4-beta-xylanase [Polyangiaceae bacterium]|nr:endo-1,4-beta-xylanase [Polyangiaceae bacterium]